MIKKLIMPSPLLVDDDDVPRFVQKMRYHYSNFVFQILFFDGTEKLMDASDVMDLLDRQPTGPLWFEAERLAERYWKEHRVH